METEATLPPILETKATLPSISVAEPPPLEWLSGAVRVRGTRVTIDAVVFSFNEGYTPEQIVRKFSTLQLPDVYAVIAFYLRHREEVDAYIEQRRQEAEEIRSKIEETRPSDRLRERARAWKARQK
jgi:uncharacterized protein (DUF433 family)